MRSGVVKGEIHPRRTRRTTDESESNCIWVGRASDAGLKSSFKCLARRLDAGFLQRNPGPTVVPSMTGVWEWVPESAWVLECQSAWVLECQSVARNASEWLANALAVINPTTNAPMQPGR